MQYRVTRNITYNDLLSVCEKVTDSRRVLIPHITGGFILNPSGYEIRVFSLPSLMHGNGMMYYKEELLSLSLVGTWHQKDIDDIVTQLRGIGIVCCDHLVTTN